MALTIDAVEDQGPAPVLVSGDDLDAVGDPVTEQDEQGIGVGIDR